jgi:hypothetical protein
MCELADILETKEARDKESKGKRMYQEKRSEERYSIDTKGA